ncbi:MAG: hypothetical protein HQ542_12040 [Bacteroidia bacterium]|nr:hypothetical protein [Bacteroidia bacterium]
MKYLLNLLGVFLELIKSHGLLQGNGSNDRNGFDETDIRLRKAEPLFCKEGNVSKIILFQNHPHRIDLINFKEFLNRNGNCFRYTFKGQCIDPTLNKVQHTVTTQADVVF